MKMNKLSPIILNGLSVSKGIAIGKCKIIEHGQRNIEKSILKKNEDIKKELLKFDNAHKSTLDELKKIKNKIKPSVQKNIILFLDTHILLINDKDFLLNIRKRIKESRYSAEWSVHQEYLNIKASFEDMTDNYIKQRIDDVQHVVNMIIKNLRRNKNIKNTSIKNVNKKIIITDDLSPADVLVAFHSKCSAIISEFGGRSSHSSILTRSMEIPSIVGVKNITKLIRDDDEIIIDGEKGIIIIHPDKGSKKYYQKIQLDQFENKKELISIMHRDAITKDKKQIELMVNLELPEELKMLKAEYIDGIGLFRTEYIYSDRDDFPSELEQYNTYKKVVQRMSGKTVIFRTLDIGADKEVPENIQSGAIARNPALGLRGIRYSLNNQIIFLNQIKAILRAAHYGNVKIMLPMITTLSEVEHAKNLIKKAKEDLSIKRNNFSDCVDIGIMIEVPSSAVNASQFAKHVDFFSIGTNDLVQYALAIDRVNDEVNYLYDPFNSAVLQLIHNVIKAGKKYNIPVSLCGEMAGDINFTRLLLGMGLQSFSMHPSAIPEIKKIILNSDTNKFLSIVKRIINNDAKKKELIDRINS